jgi:hypothetical protein
MPEFENFLAIFTFSTLRLEIQAPKRTKIRSQRLSHAYFSLPNVTDI